jgi:hypothetical protein
MTEAMLLVIKIVILQIPVSKFNVLQLAAHLVLWSADKF